MVVTGDSLVKLEKSLPRCPTCRKPLHSFLNFHPWPQFRILCTNDCFLLRKNVGDELSTLRQAYPHYHGNQLKLQLHYTLITAAKPALELLFE